MAVIIRCRLLFQSSHWNALALTSDRKCTAAINVACFTLLAAIFPALWMETYLKTWPSRQAAGPERLRGRVEKCPDCIWPIEHQALGFTQYTPAATYAVKAHPSLFDAFWFYVPVHAESSWWFIQRLLPTSSLTGSSQPSDLANKM